MRTAIPFAVLVLIACSGKPRDEDLDGYTNDFDCNDSDDLIYPGATEECDEADNDCDGDTDEPDAIDADAYYVDADADGYGDPERIAKACAQPTGWADNGSDCDDAAAGTNPGATEITGNSIDDDCNPATPD